MPKLGIIAHLPATRGFTASFLKNLESYKTANPIYLYSDSSEFGVPVIPEPKQAVGFRNLPVAAANYTFLKGLDIAIREGLDYFIFIEEDSRVRGDLWDERIMNEAFQTSDFVCGGTVSIWNMGACGAEAAKAAVRFADKHIRQTGRPPLMWSQGGGFTGEKLGLWAYPNGSGSIIHTATAAAIFQSASYDIGTWCSTCGAFDVFIGKALWNRFGLDIFSKLAIIPSMYSGYRDAAYSYQDRVKMLVYGDVCFVHQIKSDWVP